MANLNVPLYDPRLEQPMHEELTRIGYQELHTPEAGASAARVLNDAGRPLAERLDALRVVAAAGGEAAAADLIRQLDLRNSKPLIAAAIENLARDEGRAWPGIRRDPALTGFLRAALARPDWLSVNVMGDAAFGMVGLGPGDRGTLPHPDHDDRAEQRRHGRLRRMDARRR